MVESRSPFLLSASLKTSFLPRPTPFKNTTNLNYHQKQHPSASLNQWFLLHFTQRVTVIKLCLSVGLQVPPWCVNNWGCSRTLSQEAGRALPRSKSWISHYAFYDELWILLWTLHKVKRERKGEKNVYPLFFKPKFVDSVFKITYEKQLLSKHSF